MRATLRALVILVLAGGAIGGVIAYTMARRGLSTRVPPSRAEAMLASGMRRLATSAATRTRQNPVPATDAVVTDALAHFADHCAVCHANNGSGDIEIGRSLYPPAPDMRAARTQSLSDGELFAIIEHGIRLTGMPAWGTGTAEGERASWALVRFIRRLPSLTPDEIERMDALNPKSPAEFREEEDIRRFLEGDSSAAPPSTSMPPHQGDRH